MLKYSVDVPRILNKKPALSPLARNLEMKMNDTHIDIVYTSCFFSVLLQLADVHVEHLSINQLGGKRFKMTFLIPKTRH